MNENITKTCKACKKELPMSSFTASKRTKDKKEGKCKICRQSQRPSCLHKCTVCGVDYISKKKSSKCCSLTCAGELRTLNVTVSVSCVTCDKEFIKKLSDVKDNNYCGIDCYADAVSKMFSGAYRSRVDVECEHCKKNIHRAESKVRNHNFCDKICYKNGIGKTILGENHPSYNFELTQEERVRGRFYHEYRVWRTAVYTRDNFTCICCGDSTSGNLVAHHLYSYHANEELRTELNNGVTLCRGCHKEFHSMYGYKYNTTVQFIAYLKNRGTQKVCDSVE